MAQSVPFFSIIIPTYARPCALLRCLQAMTRLTYPLEAFEVIVVDDGSPQSVAQVVAEFRPKLHLTLLTQPNAGPATARNIGAAHAQGQFLAFTDDDCEPHPDWLTQFARTLSRKPDCVVGGRTRCALPANLYAMASQLMVAYLMGQGTFFASNNLGISAETFHQLNGFDHSFPLAAAEDRDLCDRLQQHSVDFYYIDQAIVDHTHRLTLRSFWQQQFNYGQGAYHYHQHRANRQGTTKTSIEPLAFYINLILYPMRENRQRPLLKSLLLVGLFIVAQAANVAGFCTSYRRTSIAFA